MEFLEWKCLDFEKEFFEIYVSDCVICKKSALIKVVARHRTGDKSLPKPVMTNFHNAIWHHIYIHSSPKVMAVFLFLIFENFQIGGMFSILETIKTDRSTLILQNKNWCQMINPMCTTFQMRQNCILQNQVCFERLISLSKTPYIFVKISKPRNWDPYSISAISHGNRTSSYETVAHKLRPSVAFDWQYTPRQKLWPFPQT